MRRYLGLAFALTIVTSVPAASQNAPANTPASQNAPVTHHRAQPATKRHPPAAETVPQDVHRPFGPYPHTGEGDNDGLSRDPDDCNKGCIDGNPG
jgi:hypothetical protein